MDILKEVGSVLKRQVFPHIKPKHQKQAIFGIQALSFSSFVSLNGNARAVVENSATAVSKMYRVVRNQKLCTSLKTIGLQSGFITKQSLVNVDFSTFCGFETLCFGVQTHLGRAIPVWANALTYPLGVEGSQNQFVLLEMYRLGHTLGFYPKFVFDRGFWIPIVMKFLLRRNIMFYLRIKQGQHLLWEQKGKKCQAVIIGKHTKDTTIVLFSYKLRLVVSPPPPKKKGKEQERWYILTNDVKSTKNHVLGIYYHRFEIEETFKDVKHIQNIKKLRIKKKQTFLTLLHFVMLSFWCCFWLKEKLTIAIHAKKKCSLFRSFIERLQCQLRFQGFTFMLGPSP